MKDVNILYFRTDTPDDILYEFKDIILFPQPLVSLMGVDDEGIIQIRLETKEGFETASIRYFVTDSILLNSFINKVFKTLN